MEGGEERERERERDTDPALITVSHDILPSSAKFSPFCVFVDQ